LDAVGIYFACVSQDKAVLFFKESAAFIEEFFDWSAQNDVIPNYVVDFVGGYVLVEISAGFDKNGWSGGACAYATCAGDFALFFYAQFFDNVLEGFY